MTSVLLLWNRIVIAEILEPQWMAVLELLRMVFGAQSNFRVNQVTDAKDQGNGVVTFGNRRKWELLVLVSFYVILVRTSRLSISVWDYRSKRKLFDQLVFLTENSCNPPRQPRNGWYETTNERFFHGTVVSFRCNPGHVMIGSQTRTCENGRWSGEYTACTGKFQ